MMFDKIRDKKEFEKLYKKYPTGYDIDWIVNNPHLYCFYDDNTGKLKGYATLQYEDGELTISGGSIRKNFLENLEALKMVLKAYNQTIYAYTKVKSAIFLLRKAGFKKLYDDKYIYEVN